MKEGLDIPADGLDVECEQNKGPRVTHRSEHQVAIDAFSEMDKIGEGAGWVGLRAQFWMF